MPAEKTHATRIEGMIRSCEFGQKLSQRIVTAHRKMAQAMGTGHLSCTRCGRRIELTEELVCESLCDGWPTCCGDTMEYHGTSVLKDAA